LWGIWGEGVADPAHEFKLSEHARHVLVERGIRLDWVGAALGEPALTEPDREDPELRHALRRIDEFGGRVLRVVYNPGQSPPRVVTAYFDRSMRDRL